MIRIFIITCFFYVLFGCSPTETKNKLYIFIPMNYTGWVNIIFNDTSSFISPIVFKDGYVYLITKDPAEYRVRNDIFISGKYDIYYYYYNTDTLTLLSWTGYPKRNIFFERTIGIQDNTKYTNSLLAFSFYVSLNPLGVDTLSVDKVPKNKIME